MVSSYHYICTLVHVHTSSINTLITIIIIIIMVVGVVMMMMIKIFEIKKK